MSDDNVINMAASSKSGKRWSPEQMLDEVKKDLKIGNLGDKMLCISLDTIDGRYGVGYHQSGMKASEMLALLEVAKSLIIKDMGY